MKTKVVVATLEMLSGSKKEYAKEAQPVADVPDGEPAANGAPTESTCAGPG